MPSAWPAISAHRGGGEIAPAGTWEAFHAALDGSGEYVEFDVRLTRDEIWVVYHHELAGPSQRPVRNLYYDELCEFAGYPVPEATAVMQILAKRVFGLLDLKERGSEHAIIGPAIEILGVSGFVAVTENPPSMRRIQSFAPAVRMALSTGNPVLGRSRRTKPRLRNRRFDHRWAPNSGADWVALNHRLASDKVLNLCRRNGIGVMLWTVNEPALIKRHLADSRVDVLITDRPQYAAYMRDTVYGTSAPSVAPSAAAATCPR